MVVKAVVDECSTWADSRCEERGRRGGGGLVRRGGARVPFYRVGGDNLQDFGETPLGWF
jgi:hypothetical protein